MARVTSIWIRVKTAAGNWQRLRRALSPLDDRVEADAESLKLAEPYDRETNNWLSRVTGDSGAELSARERPLSPIRRFWISFNASN